MSRVRPTIARGSYAQKVTMPCHAAIVVAALTTPTGLSSWWAPTTAVDGRLAVCFPISDDPLVLRVSECDGTISWTVEHCGCLPDWAGTTPAFTLTARADGWTDLAFVHNGVTPRHSGYDDCATDWNYFLLNRLLPSLPR